jgi:aspartyl protease family protein
MHRRAALCALAAAWPLGAAAQGVSLAGRMGQRALLVVDGQPLTLGIGERRLGVRLLALEPGTARIERDGQVSELREGAGAVDVAGGPPPPTAREIVLPAGPGGHFHASGAINGRPVRFMVDTGASVVALGQPDADRIGLDYRRSPRAMMQTANGTVAAHRITLSAVTLGEVTLANVPAVVMPLPMSHVLLGNSFLSRFQMRRDNDVMRLELR